MRKFSIFSDLVVPSLLYFCCFVILTYPAIGSFADALIGDSGDGLQNVWNLWWTNYSIVELHRNPFFTDYLHAPEGASLLGHPLSPLNGAAAMLLSPWLTLFQAYNTILIVSFVLTGTFTCLLARESGISRAGSLASGYLVTFSSYHFSHAQGHLELVAMEFLPLAMLFMLRLVRQPSACGAVLAASTLFAAALTNLYYGFCAVLFGLLLLPSAVLSMRAGEPDARRAALRSFVLFAALSAIGAGMPYLALLVETMRDPFVASHDVAEGSLDILGLLIPGNFWRFREWTEFYWRSLITYPYEQSVAPGLILFGLLYYFFRERIARSNPRSSVFAAGMVVFAVLSLGPVLSAGSIRIPLPYRLLDALFGFSKFSGLPIRLTVMTVLCGGIVAGTSLDHLWRRGGKRMAAAAAVLLLAVFEALPAPLPISRPLPEKYVGYLAEAALPGAVIDRYAEGAQAMYFQTIHRRPIAFGYTARVSRRTAKQNAELRRLIKRGDSQALCKQMGFGLIVMKQGDARAFSGLPVVYEDEKARIYNLCA